MKSVFIALLVIASPVEASLAQDSEASKSDKCPTEKYGVPCREDQEAPPGTIFKSPYESYGYKPDDALGNILRGHNLPPETREDILKQFREQFQEKMI